MVDFFWFFDLPVDSKQHNELLKSFLSLFNSYIRVGVFAVALIKSGAGLLTKLWI